MRVLLFITLLFLPGFIYGQYLTGVATKWSDEFTEWRLFTDTEEEEGELKLRWITRLDWTEWQYRVGERFGSIKLKWNNNPNEWEIRGDSETVTARTLWSNNFREWRIRSGSIQFTLKCRYGNVIDEWQIQDSEYGAFQMYTNWEGDPRDWIINDELDERVPFTVKMAMAFIVAYHSFPKD